MHASWIDTLLPMVAVPGAASISSREDGLAVFH